MWSPIERRMRESGTGSGGAYGSAPLPARSADQREQVLLAEPGRRCRCR